MKKSTSIVVSLILFTMVFISCENGQSLQKYYIESEQSDNFIALDVPASIISLKEDVSPETKETLKSLRKLNVLAFKIDEDNNEEFLSENKKIKEILKNKEYKELKRGKHESSNIMVR